MTLIKFIPDSSHVSDPDFGLILGNVLDAAAEHLERVGWVKGTLVDESKVSEFITAGLHPSVAYQAAPVCAAGAIRLAVNESPISQSIGSDLAEVALANFLDPTVKPLDPYGRISGWNDAPKRTADEVIATLRKAAEYERACSTPDAA